MIVRAAILGFSLIALIGFGLYLVPFEEVNSGVVAFNGSEFTIHDGNFESIPFTVSHNGSRLAGSVETSQNVSLYISPSSPYNSSVYNLPNGTSFSLNVMLPKGSYYLVFVALSDTETRSPPIYILIQHTIIVQY